MTTELDTLLNIGTVATPEEILAASESDEIYTPAMLYASVENRIRANERETLCQWLETEFAAYERADKIIAAIRNRN